MKYRGKRLHYRITVKNLKKLSYGRAYKSMQRQYDPNSNDHIFDTTAKTTVPSSNYFHDQITTLNPNF